MPNQTVAQKSFKAAIVDKFKTSPSDTGSSEVQVALLTNRIQSLTEHMKKNKFDHASERGLVKLVGQRRRLLDYLKVENPASYTAVIQALELRK